MREAFLLDKDGGWRFGIASRPAEVPRGGLLYVPPFAEEMNRCRRQAALAARAFAKSGWLVLQLDLHGTGDSSGDFADATWASWLADLTLARSWLERELPTGAPIVFWTLRAGSLLAAEWIRAHDASVPLLLWQPLPAGRGVVSNFLRLAAAAEMLEGSAAKDASRRVRTDLAEGRSTEIAGYELSPGVATGLERAQTSLEGRFRSPVSVIEVAPGADTEPAPALRALADRLEGVGVDCELFRVVGPRFWQTQEIETAPELVPTSLRFLRRVAP